MKELEKELRESKIKEGSLYIETINLKLQIKERDKKLETLKANQDLILLRENKTKDALKQISQIIIGLEKINKDIQINEN